MTKRCLKIFKKLGKFSLLEGQRTLYFDNTSPHTFLCKCEFYFQGNEMKLKRRTIAHRTSGPDRSPLRSALGEPEFSRNEFLSSGNAAKEGRYL